MKKGFKNLFLFAQIISLSLVMVTFLTSFSIYVENEAIYTSSYFDDMKNKTLIEKDFYKTEGFDRFFLNGILDNVANSINSKEKLVDYYMRDNFEKDEKDGKVIYWEPDGEGGKKQVKKEEVEKIIEKDIKNSKDILKGLNNINIIAVNSKNGMTFSNTDYKSIDEFLANNDHEYVKINLDLKGNEDTLVKSINNEESKSHNNLRGYTYFNSTREKDGNEYKVYATLPKIEELEKSGMIYELYQQYKQTYNYINKAISLITIFCIVLIVSILGYWINKEKIYTKENGLIKVLNKIPFDLLILSYFLLSYILFLISLNTLTYEGFINYTNLFIGIYTTICSIIIYIGYLLIKTMCSYDDKKDLIKKSLTGRVLSLFIKILKKIFRLAKKTVKNTMNIALDAVGLSKEKKVLRYVFISGIVSFFIFVFSVIAFSYNNPFLLMIIGILIILFFSLFIIRNFVYIDKIEKGVNEIKNGQLNYKIEIKEKEMFCDLASGINNIGEGLEKSIHNQLKSERMKSELITNVSHDLKTPLTSIINYVELINTEKNIQPEYIRDYVNVLDSKSKRLKILIEDLFEASKASSGNLELNMEKIDLKQLLEQSIGEMQEKLLKSKLNLKVNMPKDKLYIMADGKRLYRVFENLLSNVSKYALENTRVYIDLLEEGGFSKLIIKNISSYEMNFDEGEILERFKRADEARNTEGSGLGLSIAKDLVNLQGGKFKVDVDGDLFKVIIKFEKI